MIFNYPLPSHFQFLGGDWLVIPFGVDQHLVVIIPRLEEFVQEDHIPDVLQ